MPRFLPLILSVCIAMTVSGCGTVNSGWVTDPDQYWKGSGFAVQAPSASNWYRIRKENDFPNSVVFRKVDWVPIRMNAYHPDFNITFAMAIGQAVGKPVVAKGSDGAAAERGLREIFESYREKAGIDVSATSSDNSLGAQCLKYKGKPRVAEYNTESGKIRYDSVDGYFCLHPDYDDYIVILESRNGATVEITPKNPEEQIEHFFRSIRFTHRDILPKRNRKKDEGRLGIS